MNKIAEFFVELGVAGDSKTLKEFVGEIENLPVSVASGIASLIGLEFELTKLASEAMEAAVGFQMFGAQTGLSWQELQKWQIVAQQAHVSAEAVASSVTALQKNLAEIRLGRGNIAPFQMLGVAPTGDAFHVLDQVRQRIRGLDAATATNMISQMGLSPEMINVLRLSNEEFGKLSKTISGLTSEEQKGFLKSKDALIAFGMTMKQEGIDVAYHFLTALQMLSAKIPEWSHGLVMVRDVVIALAIAFFPLQAAIVGLLLLLDDLAVYFQGGKSLTGVGIEGLKKLGAEMKEAFDIPNLATGALMSAGVQYPTASGIVSGVGGGLSGVHNVFNIVGSGPKEIAEEVARVIERQFGQAEQQLDNQGH